MVWVVTYRVGSSVNGGVWSFEGVGVAHIILAGLLFAAAIWHWTFWDLDVFRSSETVKNLSLDLPKVFAIHLLLAGLSCLAFGAFH